MKVETYGLVNREDLPPALYLTTTHENTPLGMLVVIEPLISSHSLTRPVLDIRLIEGHVIIGSSKRADVVSTLPAPGMQSFVRYTVRRHEKKYAGTLQVCWERVILWKTISSTIIHFWLILSFPSLVLSNAVTYELTRGR